MSLPHLLRRLGLFLSAPLVLLSAQLPEESVIWADRENGMAAHFVYGLTATPRGTVLAFAEARIGTWKDDGPHDLVLKRSTDGGRTWLAGQVIERADGAFWRAAGERDRPECWTNPAALTDRNSGRVFIFYALSEGANEGKNMQRFTRVFYRFSDDEGVTWSDRVEVTALLNARADGTPNVDAAGRPVVDANGFPCDHLGRAFHMPGPGHGLQLKSGRLILPFWNRTAIGDARGEFPREARRYGLRLILSDDGGRTWRTGPAFGEEFGPTESRLVELDDGSLYLNARSDGTDHGARPRAIFRSRDQGLTWTADGFDPAMPPYSAVDSGLNVIRHQGRQVILLSHPRSPTRREGLTISASLDGGRTWALHKAVHDAGSSYSDLVVLPDGTVGLLYGNGASLRDGCPVKFLRFTPEWLGL